jgi:adsorption protein B
MLITGYELLVILRDFCLALTWFVALVFLLSGVQDLIYDIGAYSLRFFRRVHYRNRERLSLARLRAREQQRIAVLVPAWNEGEVVGAMVANIIERVEYRNYVVFVGTYPNDARTQNAVNRLAAQHPQIVNVVNVRPGPTTKADCLNNVYRTLKAYEEREGINFDILVMHDAEDVVHPHSFLLYNYLIPRVDAIQLPILPLPTAHHRIVHWIYADEFSETHMKDVPVREKISGFVPFAGTGTGFSRRAFTTLEMGGEKVYNEGSMTEDYSMSKRMREAGLRIIFVNVVLADDKSKWWVPLYRRPGFISNWAYFPMDFTRSIRQKTRWIIGISLQEWEHGGWKGNIRMKENFVKDRKIFLAASSSLLGYALLVYFILLGFGQLGIVPFKLLPIIEEGSVLHRLVVVDTGFMIFRMLERVVFVGMTYGLLAGLLAIPRLLIANVINGIAAFRALQTFARARQGKTAVRWDNTDHLEGVGQLPTAAMQPVAKAGRTTLPPDEVLRRLRSGSEDEVPRMMESLPRNLEPAYRDEAIEALQRHAGSESLAIRSTLARVIGFLVWPELVPALFALLHDREWVVRANGAKALLKYPDFDVLLEQAFVSDDPLLREVLVRSVEQDNLKQRVLLPRLDQPQLIATRSALLAESAIIRHDLAALSGRPYLAAGSSAEEEERARVNA